MTDDEFNDLMLRTPIGLPVPLADGRMGLATKVAKGGYALIDAYRGNECAQIPLPVSSLRDLGNGALAEVAA